MSKDYEEQIANLKKKMNKILQQEIYNIKDVERRKTEFSFKGVYLIRRPDTKKIVYIGKTSAGISNRMHQHLHMQSGSDLHIIIKKFPEFPQDAKSYLVQFYEIQNDRERGLVENFLSSVINPILSKIHR